MVCGFDFSLDSAVNDCKLWLASCPDVEIEYIETQRASIVNILRLNTSLSSDQQAVLVAVERLLHDYLIDNAAEYSQTPTDEALGGDLLYLPPDLGII